MKKFHANEIDKINLDESGIISISWVNDEKDLNLLIDWCGQEDLAETFDFNNIICNLYFDFVTNVEVNFRFDDGNMRALEISEFNYFIDEQGIYNIEIVFYFQPVGFIKFKCNNFEFIVED